VLGAPPIELAVRDGVHLAYQAAGTGPPCIVFVAGSTATSLSWNDPVTAKGFRRLASFSRLITYDQRGTGYSDRFSPAESPTLDDLVTDLRTVIEAVGVDAPVLFGTHNGGAVAAVYATAYPVRQLVLCNTWARLEEADDFPIGFSDQILDRLEEQYLTQWGKGRIYNQFAPRRDPEPAGQAELASTSPNQLQTIFRMNRKYDIRHQLPAVAAPTLVIHLRDNVNIPYPHAEFIAQNIPGARLVLLPGTDQAFLRNYATPVIDEVEHFVTGRLTAFLDRLWVGMLFTDIVDSTHVASSLGDEQWSALIDEHNLRMQQRVRANEGHVVKNTGDGFLVAFDDAAPAIRCALAAMTDVDDLGVELRAGVHVGEVSRMGANDFSGLAVHFAQRLCARAEGGQLLTSEDVRAACGDSDIVFEDRGRATFKGIPGKWEVFEVRR
jgi:class 3 adenylate cyclase/alpha-beta hydrolase superfamily lysophospholipase